MLPRLVRTKLAVGVLLASSGLRAQDRPLDFKAPADVTVRATNILSEGTRMAAAVFAPEGPQKREAAHNHHESRLGRHRGGIAPRRHRVRTRRVPGDYL